jgi:hypothetical protein
MLLSRAFAPSFLLALLALFVSVGCPRYEGPPEAALVGIEDGLLPDATAPIVVAFNKPIDRDTLRVRIVRFETDPEGELLAGLEPLYAHDPTQLFDVGGRSSLDETMKYFTIEATETFPVGPQLAVVIEADLADLDGNKWNIPRILKFGFEFDCGGDDAAAPTTLPSAVYYMLADVEKPISAQLQLFIDMRVDSETGDWMARFTNADRDPTIDCSPYGLSCTEKEVCRTLPEPACVQPSERAASVAEHVDFYPNYTPPIGYSFAGVGCAADVGEGRWAASNAPTDVKVESPDITVKGITFNLELVMGDDGLVAGGGTLTAQQVFIGVAASGTGAGSAVMIQIPEELIPDDLPAP